MTLDGPSPVEVLIRMSVSYRRLRNSALPEPGVPMTETFIWTPMAKRR
jgi:hypothetical protein